MMGLSSFFGMRGHFYQLAVHAVADAEPVFHGLNVDVGSPHFESVRQHLLHQPDNGSILPFQPVGFFRNAQIPVKFIQPAFHSAAGGDAENHIPPHQLGQAVHGFQIQGIVNGNVDGKTVVGNGDGPEAPGKFRRNEFAHLLGDVHGAQVHDGEQGV